MGPPQGAGWVANAIWGRITPCCLAASRSNESPLIDSAGPVCGQQRSNDRLVRSAWSHPLAFASTRLACTPALLPQVPSGRYSARLIPSAAVPFACTHQGLNNPGNRTIQQINYLTGTHAPIPGDLGSWSRPGCQRDSRRSQGDPSRPVCQRDTRRSQGISDPGVGRCVKGIVAARKSPNAKLPAAHRTEAGDAGRRRIERHKGSRIALETSQSVQEESTGLKTLTPAGAERKHCSENTDRSQCEASTAQGKNTDPGVDPEESTAQGKNTDPRGKHCPKAKTLTPSEFRVGRKHCQQRKHWHTAEDQARKQNRPPSASKGNV